MVLQRVEEDKLLNAAAGSKNKQASASRPPTLP